MSRFTFNVIWSDASAWPWCVEGFLIHSSMEYIGHFQTLGRFMNDLQRESNAHNGIWFSVHAGKKCLSVEKMRLMNAFGKCFPVLTAEILLFHIFFYARFVLILSVSFSHFCLLLVLISLFSLGLTQALALVSCLKRKVQLQRQKLLWERIIKSVARWVVFSISVVGTQIFEINLWNVFFVCWDHI